MSDLRRDVRPQRALRALGSVCCLAVLVLCGCGGGGGGGGGGSTPAFTRLWVPHFNAAELRAFAYRRALADTDAAPDVVLTLPAGTHPNALTFDSTGALWVTDNANARLLKFDKAQLGAGGSPTPAVHIDSDGASLQGPIGFAFDGSQDLWVAVQGGIEMFVPTNLDDSGPTTPNLVLDCASFDIPAGMLFDAAGDLWVSNASFAPANNAVLVFTPDQLVAGGVQTPRLAITCAAFALIEGIGFDGSGGLWVSSNDGLNVTHFLAQDVAVPAVATVRNLVPANSLEADADDGPSGRSVRKPGGLVFDRDGDLFVNSERGAMGADDSAVLRFAKTQLATLVGAQALQAIAVHAHATSNPGFGGLALELP